MNAIVTTLHQILKTSTYEKDIFNLFRSDPFIFV